MTTRGGLACISSWRSSSASRAVRRPSRSADLYIRLVWLSLGLLAGLLLLLGDHRLEDEPVALLIQAPRDLVAHAVQLGLAAQLDLAQERGDLVGDDPARRSLLGFAPARAAPGPR